jgi:hypothetical protein
MTKTKWLVEPNRIIIYPSFILRLIALISGGILTCIWLFIIISTMQYGVNPGIFLGLIFILIMVLIMTAAGNTTLTFDAATRRMYKRPFGMLSAQTLDFDQIAAIQSVGGTTGMTYRAYLKSDRHGKGIIISPGFRDAQDKNAIRFRQEVLPQLEAMVVGGQPTAANTMPLPITTFEYYDEKDNIYTLKQSKTGSIVLVIILLAVWGWMLYMPGISKTTSQKMWPLVLLAIPILLIIYGLFTTISLDKNNRKIVRASFGSLFRKEYSFDDFVRFLIVRKTTNLVYAGTDVRMQLNVGNQSRELNLRSFQKTNKIERFLEETGSILGR